MNIAMAGQPNSGKSTIFNHVAGYKTITSNFPGKTVEYTESKVTIGGTVHTLIDLPGTYSLTSLDPAELEARNYLLRRHADVTINVVDASLLARSIELTIQISELEVPYILVLNMMDEARKKGVTIDKERLSRELGVPVVEAMANKGVGITQALEAAIAHAGGTSHQHVVRYSKHVEDAILGLMPHIEGHAKAHGLPARLFSLKLLEADPYFENLVPASIMEDVVLPAREGLEEDHGQPSDVVISSERHAQALNIFERVAHVAKAVKALSERLDGFLMHPVYGYAALIVILYGFFNIIFRAGNALEPPIMDFFVSEVEPAVLAHVPEGFASTAVTGIIQGIAGGIGIVLPYLLPFLMGLSLLEDVGYLPRIAFLLDSFLHKIGLHGKSIIPFILGYGCSVPAIMGARILESRRDRFIVITLTSMIPCAARITVILALVGVFLGGSWALFVFLFNIAVLALVGYILSRLMPEDVPGMMLEIPAYHQPSLKVIMNKTWFRMKEFIVVAWPIIIAGSLALSMLEYLEWVSYINTAFSPLTLLLGLPVVVGTTLVFGVLRKELAMLMLFQALGTDVVLDVMTKTQIMTFTMFIIFYVPCVATIGVMVRELGKRGTGLAIGIGLLVATVVGVLTRITGMVL